MNSILGNLVRRSRIFKPLRKWTRLHQETRVLKGWERDGCPAPPPNLVKQRTLKAYAEEYNLPILVETGTYKGDMVAATKDAFQRIYSIELGDDLFSRAKERFKTEKNVELFHGDSGIELGKIVRKLDDPALFWLDAHYSGGITARAGNDSPILKELTQILTTADPRCVLLIDDARLFGVDPAYPTLENVEQYVDSIRKDMVVTVKHDIIRIIPGPPKKSAIPQK